MRVRIGGVGGILHTLFHIVDVEWSWIHIMQGKPDFPEDFSNYQSLILVRELDAKYHSEVEEFITRWDSTMEHNEFQDTSSDGTIDTFTWGEVIRHVIAHEIHHIGQLSVWSREIGRKPVSANLIYRGFGRK
ncbi:DinB family protein [Bacillaceae bacterium Marseille-Q3522]|nr:DinB family protein [Bacillaceae bacterium Marseille-Q3522]